MTNTNSSNTNISPLYPLTVNIFFIQNTMCMSCHVRISINNIGLPATWTDFQGELFNMQYICLEIPERFEGGDIGLEYQIGFYATLDERMVTASHPSLL